MSQGSYVTGTEHRTTTTSTEQGVPSTESRRRPVVVPSHLDGRAVAWREGEELRRGVVERVTDRDMVYVTRDTGARYYLPLHRLLVL
jgi:hypothetical protein